MIFPAIYWCLTEKLFPPFVFKYVILTFGWRSKPPPPPTPSPFTVQLPFSPPFPPKYIRVEGQMYAYLYTLIWKKSGNYDYKLSSWVCLTDTRPVKHSFCLKQTFKIEKLTATCIILLKWLHMNLNNMKLKALNIILIESLKLLVYKQGRMLPKVIPSFTQKILFGMHLNSPHKIASRTK